jgi:DNA invertase Pin-like site-specific DNA recombinase
VRISQDREGLEQGVERQETACRKLAEQRGWEVSEVYSDNDTSATSRKPRKAWERLLHDLETDGLGAVVSYSSSRMYRRPADLVRLIAVSKLRGIQVATVTNGNIVLDTAQGRMIAGILAEVDQAEVEVMAERRAAQRAQVIATAVATDGEVSWHGGGRRPLGYRVKGGIVVDKVEAKVVRGLVEAALAGQSLYRMAADLNERGVKTAGGNRWRPAHVRRLLLSPFHAGMTRTGAHKGDWPAIISENEQKVLRARLSTRKGTPRGAARYLLSGIASCAACGTSLVGSAGLYRCSAQSGGCGKVSVVVPAFDRHVLGEVRSELVRRILDQVPEDHEDHVDTPDPIELEHEELLGELADAQGRLDRIAGQVADGVLDDRQAKIAGDKLRAKLAELEGKLRAESDRAPVRLSEADVELVESWDAERILEVRDLIQSVVAKITICKGHGFTPERVGITWAESEQQGGEPVRDV